MTEGHLGFRIAEEETGGIGGVHRGAQKTFDISADLQELAHTNVAVVCAGCKSILDIGLTLEYLETMGVPVIGNGTDEFPAFYCRNSGFKLDYAARDEAEGVSMNTRSMVDWAATTSQGLEVVLPRMILAPASRAAL